MIVVVQISEEVQNGQVLRVERTVIGRSKPVALGGDAKARAGSSEAVATP
jgi:hypothetical protein